VVIGLCLNLGREAVRAKDAVALRQLIGAAGARTTELANAAFDEQQGVTLVYFAAQENDCETLELLLTASMTNESPVDMQQRGRRGSLSSGVNLGGQLRLADRPVFNPVNECPPTPPTFQSRECGNYPCLFCNFNRLNSIGLAGEQRRHASFCGGKGTSSVKIYRLAFSVCACSL
jgi:hypothetical protein